MGTLGDLQIPTTEIETPGGSFSVRGLALADFMTIAQSHGPQASMLFAKVMNKEKIDPNDVRVIIGDIIPQAPDMVAMAIALAADEEDMAPKVKRLPFQKQLQALEAIFGLTITSEAELKNFMESIIRMLSSVNSGLQQIRLPLSEAGFGDSVGK